MRACMTFSACNRTVRSPSPHTALSPPLLLAGSINDEVISVAGVDVRLACEPPLKRFLKTPRLKEDLAKRVQC